VNWANIPKNVRTQKWGCSRNECHSW